MAERTDIKPCDVFVSWTGKDRATKDRIVGYLEGRGLSCIDSDRICAGDFTKWSAEAVRFGTVFLPIITENTAGSQYMPLEAEQAKKLDDAGNRILPVATDFETYTANGFDFHQSQSAVILGEAFSDERLAELYEKVVSLINNRAFQAYAHSKSYIKLALLYREKQMGKDLSLDYDAIYLPRTVKDEAEGDGAYPFDEALTAGGEVLYLHGPAGSGKSQYINEIKKKLSDGYLTVSLACAKAAMAEGALDTLLYEEFCRLAGTRVYSPAVFAGLLQSKHLVLVLDGLDEIPTEAGMRHFMEKVADFYLPRKEKITMLFTGRNPDDVKHLSLGEEKVHSYLLEKLTEKEIKRLSANLFLSFGSGEKGNEFYLQAKSLHEEIRSNPLLLSQLAIVYENTGNVPETVIGILDAVSAITFRIDDERAWEGIPKEYHGMLKNIPSILKRFSFERYQLQSRGKTASVGKILKHILKAQYVDFEARAEVLEEYLNGRAILVDNDFAHNMFLEYFTAVSYYEGVFDDYGEVEDQALLKELFSHYRDPYWSAVVKLFLVKADSEIDKEITESLYQTILIYADVKEYTLLFDTCRDLLRYKTEAQTVLLGDILTKSAEGVYPPYGPLFYYVPTYHLYEELILAQEKVKVTAEGLALVRDVCWIYGCQNTLAEITDKVDGRALFERGKQGLKGVRYGLCELFYLGATDLEAEDGEVFPRCFSLAEAKSFLETGCGIMAPLGEPFKDEMGLFSMDMLSELDGEWIGLLASHDAAGDLEGKLYTRSGLKVTGLVWSAEIQDQWDIPYYSNLIVLYLMNACPVSPPQSVRDMWKYENKRQYFCHKVVIPDSVTEIGWYAFAGFSSLTEIHIPDSVTCIGKYAFAGCSGLTEIHIPDSVTHISDNAFEGCRSLAEIHIPDGVSFIEYSAFEGCCGLKEIHIPESVAYIRGSAFEGCTSLTEIRISDGVIWIEYSAFEGCSSLKEIHIPDSVTKIGESAFKGCSSLKEIRIPDGVTSIGNYTFSGCTGLTEIHIPESVTYIGGSAFQNCSSLTEIHIPDSVTDIGESAFEGCSSLEKIMIPPHLEKHFNTRGDVGKNVTVILSEEYAVRDEKAIVGEGSLSINEAAFQNDLSLAIVEIAEGVQTLENSSFAGCNNLTEIHIPDSVTEIGGSAFAGCSRLKEIHIPDSVTYIGGDAFRDCSSLTKIHIPNSEKSINAKSIGAFAYAGCSSLKEVHIPDSVTEIGQSAFRGCSGLTEIHIPDSVTSIDWNVFADCSSLEKIHIPDGVKWIDNSALEGCSSLTKIHIPDSVTEIFSSAFKGCSSLTKIHIPDSVTRIGWYAFEGCISLTKIHIPDSVTCIGKSVFKGCGSLTEIHIPDSVTEIGEAAFNGCTGLTEIHIPESVTYIGGSAFQNCSSLTEIRIPDSVTEIGNAAFKDCAGLTEIKIPKSVRLIGDGAFSCCTGLKRIKIGYRFECDMERIFGAIDPRIVTFD